MASERRIAGLISVQINGEIQNAEGEFSYNLGAPKREALIGPDRVHGFKETAQVAYIEGSLRDRKTLDLQTLVNQDSATVTLQLANGKLIVLREAWFAGDGTANTDSAKVDVRFEGMSAEEVR